MKIAIDFDGVLHLYSKGWNGGEIYDPPVPGAKEAMQKLKAQGHTLYIFSTRSNKIFRKNDPVDHNKAMKNTSQTTTTTLPTTCDFIFIILIQ
ncbi:MAG: hypothetical protein AAFY70_16695 [Bacteroidota bacterium]